MLKKANVYFQGGYNQSSKKYEYLTMDSNLNKGDQVIVETKNGLSVAIFNAYKDDEVDVRKDGWLKFIVGAVEIQGFEDAKYKALKDNAEATKKDN